MIKPLIHYISKITRPIKLDSYKLVKHVSELKGYTDTIEKIGSGYWELLIK